MATVSIVSRWLAAGSVLAATPASASPNVFWTFGFDRHYAHGTGGRAELPKSVKLAAVSMKSRLVAAPDVALALIEPMPLVAENPDQGSGASASGGQ